MFVKNDCYDHQSFHLIAKEISSGLNIESQRNNTINKPL